jgi:phenylacetate-CoA ligase
VIACLNRFGLRKSQRSIDGTLRCLVGDAYRSVPLVRQRLDEAGVSPRDVRGVSDLVRLPISSRHEILTSPVSASLRRGTDPLRCQTTATSGTSGLPLTVYMSGPEAAYRRLLLFRALRRAVRLSLPFSIAEVGAGSYRLLCHRGDISQRVGLVRVSRIDRTLPPKAQAERLLAASPDVVTGHPSCLELVAEAIRDEGGWSGRRPKLVAARGEILREETRVLLGRTFECPVVDHYSCEEIGNIAWECPTTPGVMHVNSDGCVVEIVDDEGHPVAHGEEGRVVVSNLFNRTMPFLRYEVGDRAAFRPPGRCACGHRGPSLSLLAGRSGDFVLLSTGERISPRAIHSVIATATRSADAAGRFDLRRYQVLQDAPGTLSVLVVPPDPARPDLEERILDAFRQFDSRLDVSVERVSEISTEASGKFRVVRVEAQGWPSPPSTRRPSSDPDTIST